MNKYFLAWYQDQRHYRLAVEDWIYIAVLIVGGLNAFGLGMIIGTIWARLL